MGFPTSYGWSAYVTPKSPKGGSKTDFFSFRNKIHFQCNKAWYDVSLCRVVEQSISYEITEKYRTEHVSFHLKYWLNWPTPLLLARRTLSALPNDVMSKIQSGQLHSELFGRRHSKLQSHGLFALAKPLLCSPDKALRRTNTILNRGVNQSELNR